jgi:hypothetical protein
VRALAVGFVVLPLLVGCGGGGGSTSLERGPARAGFDFTAESAVVSERSLDARFTCDGQNVAPTLVWTGVPEEARELALVLEDPDAPGGTFTHWLVWGLDPGLSRLEGGEGRWTGYGPRTVSEGRNDFGSTGYGGPCPPRGEEHRYVFRLLALRARVDLESGASRAAFDAAVAPLVLAEARLTATYRRP